MTSIEVVGVGGDSVVPAQVGLSYKYHIEKKIKGNHHFKNFTLSAQGDIVTVRILSVNTRFAKVKLS